MWSWPHLQGQKGYSWQFGGDLLVDAQLALLFKLSMLAVVFLQPSGFLGAIQQI